MTWDLAVRAKDWNDGYVAGQQDMLVRLSHDNAHIVQDADESPLSPIAREVAARYWAWCFAHNAQVAAALGAAWHQGWEYAG